MPTDPDVSPIVTCLTGAVGDTVYAYNQYGPYERRRLDPAEPNTAEQQTVKTAFTKAAQNWAGLNPTKRDAWQAYGVTQRYRGRCGRWIHSTGQLEFTRSYVLWNLHGLTTDIEAAPTHDGAIEFTAIPTILYINTAPGFLRVLWEETDRFYQDGGWLLLDASLSRPNSRHFPEGPWSFRTAWNLPVHSPFTFKVGIGCPAGHHLFCRIRAYSIDNRVSGLQRVDAFP